MLLVQDLDASVVGKTIRLTGRRPMKVLELIDQNDCPIKPTILRVIVDQVYERVVKIRTDTEVLEVDVSS